MSTYWFLICEDCKIISPFHLRWGRIDTAEDKNNVNNFLMKHVGHHLIFTSEYDKRTFDNTGYPEEEFAEPLQKEQEKEE